MDRNTREQYADDIWLSLWYDEDNINEVLAEFVNFEDFSGLKMNFSKSVIIPIGSKRHSDVRLHTICPLQWFENPIKILAIWIHPDLDIVCELNYSPLLQKTRDIITVWKYRTLSPIGRIRVINMLISSLYFYVCLHRPSGVLNSIKLLLMTSYGKRTVGKNLIK